MAQTPLDKMNNSHVQSQSGFQEVTMSLLQRTGVYQKTDHWHPAFRPSGVMTSDVSEVTETDEDVLIPNARDAPRLVPDDVLERAAAAAYEQVIKYVDSEKWCGDQRTKYAVLKVEATSFVLAVICVALALVLVSVMFPDALIGP
jgi:hypothetical protein